jgi:hypothetical protein
LLVDNAILFKEGMYDLPLIVDIDLIAASSVQGPVRDGVAVLHRRTGSSTTSTRFPVVPIRSVAREQRRIVVVQVHAQTHF